MDISYVIVNKHFKVTYKSNIDFTNDIKDIVDLKNTKELILNKILYYILPYKKKYIIFKYINPHNKVIRHDIRNILNQFVTVNNNNDAIYKISDLLSEII